MGSQISEGAKQLYEYMKANYEVRDGEKEFEVLGVFYADSMFDETYKAYLDELLAIKAIRIKSGGFCIFRARLQSFVDLEASEQSSEELTGRYNPEQQQHLAELFRSFALQRKSGKFSEKTIHGELLYYSNFSVEVVMISAGRYLGGSKQVGPSYFRGILRGVDKEKTSITPTTSSTQISPNNQHQAKRQLAEQVRSKIDHDKFSTLTPSDQAQYLQRLEQECFDANRSS